jgi:transcriptional regulator with XRE-family HTH domain
VQIRTRKRFGSRIVDLRKQHGWSQEQLSEKTDISTQHLSNIENGHKEACLDLIDKLAKSFNLTIAELMAGV